ncbi:MAG: cobalamin biosynthesis protein CobW [Ruminococcaceae bacterium]|nr:cobalamin biosynthesis protein CobW [Oscillospiraceae bacterium]
MIKVNIISGFLGAGKTTLIKKLIGEVYKNEKIALIENEFGEIGIDGGFLKNSGIEIKEMNSGCICCSLVGDFGESLKEMANTYQPERIIIEPTGVGKLSDVIGAIEKVDGVDLELDCAITVVDGTKCKLYMKNFGEFYNNQVENATCILMTRMDKITEDKLSEAVSMLKTHNNSAPIITTPLDQLTADKILDAINGSHSLLNELLEAHHEHHHHGEECCHDHEHHHHGEECCHDHDHHHHGEECCHDHEHHHHGEECCHDHEHHHHGEECSCGCGGHHHHHDADEAFVSWGTETAKAFSKAELKEILSALDTGEYGIVLRGKGIVRGENDWICFDYVPGEFEIRDGSPDYTGKVCVIGSNLAQDKLEKLFAI